MANLLGKVLRIRRSNEPMKALIRQHAARLAPGVYLIQGGIAYKQGCRLPDHLKSARHVSYRRISYRRLKHSVRTILMIGTHWVRIDGTPGGFPILTSKPSNKEWDVILLNPEQAQVMRICRRFRCTPDYVALREQAATYLPTPRFEVREGGYVIVEDYVEGKHLQDCSADEARLVVGYLLDHIRHGAATLATPAPDDTAQSMQNYLDQTGLVRLEPIASCNFEVLIGLLSAPKIPAHNDLNPNNIVVAEQGPIIIDWDTRTVNRVPFWYDAAYLIIAIDRFGFWQGAYDSQLRSIFEATPSLAFNLSEYHWELEVARRILEYPLFRLIDPSIIPEHKRQCPVAHFESYWNRKGSGQLLASTYKN